MGVTTMLQRTLALGALLGMAYGGAIATARYLTRGDEWADDFQFVTIMGGADRVNRAEPLYYGRAIVIMGAMRLDLRGAELAEDGARLDVIITLGGLEVIVSPAWDVEVEQLSLGGELDVDVTPRDQLEADAPRLRIFAETRVGGGRIASR